MFAKISQHDFDPSLLGLTAHVCWLMCWQEIRAFKLIEGLRAFLKWSDLYAEHEVRFPSGFRDKPDNSPCADHIAIRQSDKVLIR